MKKNNLNTHHRRSIRLKKYDYSSPGAYFITICTFKHHCLFGDVKDDNVILSRIGRIVEQYWQDITGHFEHIITDEYIIMPNHIHGIMIITSNQSRDTAYRVPTAEKFSNPRVGSIPTVIRSFKSAVTRWCHHQGFKNFRWQSRYYEHIIRNENELNQIREYIKLNPLKWDLDRENPVNWDERQ